VRFTATDKAMEARVASRPQLLSSSHAYQHDPVDRDLATSKGLGPAKRAQPGCIETALVLPATFVMGAGFGAGLTRSAAPMLRRCYMPRQHCQDREVFPGQVRSRSPISGYSSARRSHKWHRRVFWPAAPLPLLLTAFLPAAVSAGQPVALSESDFSFGLAEYTEGEAWADLDTSNLDGVFGPHRCQCPESMAPVLQPTSTGQTNIGSSNIGVTFYLGDNCYAAPASCTSLGQASFSGSQQGSAPKFSSKVVFEAATGSTSPSCTSLSASSTTLWAILTQDGKALSFSLTIDLPVSGDTVGAPTGVTAAPANQGILVSWAPPDDASLVAGYQVLCLPRPANASTAGYQSCGIVSNPEATILTPNDETQLCSALLSATARSVRVTGLTNGTAYTVAVIAIDPSGGTSAPSSPAAATPQPTISFWDKYKQAGGGASGCSVSHSGAYRSAHAIASAVSAALGFLFLLYRRRKQPSRLGKVALLSVLLIAPSVRAQESLFQDSSLDEPSLLGMPNSAFGEPTPPRADSAPKWGFQLGVSLYRPDVDGEFRNDDHPFAETFSSSRHLLSVAELDRYLPRRLGTWGVGLRVGYYRTTSAAFLTDGITRSGDQTELRLIPISLSMLYFADGLPLLQTIPLIPYAKLGLDGTTWKASSTGESSAQAGLSLGWHATAGLMLGLTFLSSSAIGAGAIADPCAIFFEWSYAAINGLGLSNALHVGDSTWFAGIAFDL